MKKKNKLTQQDIVVLILGESDSPLSQSSIHEKVLNHPSFISNADHPERNISSVLITHCFVQARQCSEKQKPLFRVAFLLRSALKYL